MVCIYQIAAKLQICSVECIEFFCMKNVVDIEFMWLEKKVNEEGSGWIC